MYLPTFNLIIMNKRFLNALLCSALFFLSGTFFVSCSDDDNSDLENRVSVLEGLIDDIKSQLSKAITVGATVTNWDSDNRIITLNDGTKIDLGTLSEGGGGEASNITVGDGVIIISIGGVEYALPLATTVNSLVYCPESIDPVIYIDQAANVNGVTVRFLATPALSADALSKAQITIADAREVKTRANSSFFKLKDLKADGDLIQATMKVWDATPGKIYTVAVYLSMPGTTISSNYFYVSVGDDISVVTEDLSVAPTFKGLEGAVQNEDGSWTAILPDGTGDVPAFLGSVKFQEMITVPGVEKLSYALAPADQQNESVRNNYSNLSANLSADGTWNCMKRPGTTGGEEGLLILAKDADDVTRAKVYIKVIDPLADIDFQALCGVEGNFEAELYGRDGRFVAPGKNELDIPTILNEWETEIPIRHSGDAFFVAYANYNVSTETTGSLVYNDGSGQLVLGDFAKKYLGGARGVFWYYRGFMLVVPETLATDGKYIDETGEYGGGEGYGYDTWGSGNPADYVNNPNFYSFRPGDEFRTVASFGWKMNEKTGVLTTPNEYEGWGVRVAFAAGFEYAYGVKSLCGKGADQLGMLFINRRAAAEDAKMPSKK